MNGGNCDSVMNQFITIKFTPQGYNAVVQHLQRGAFQDVAELLGDMQRQVQEQIQAQQASADTAPSPRKPGRPKLVQAEPKPETT